jgi:hypothetical protein
VSKLTLLRLPLGLALIGSSLTVAYAQSLPEELRKCTTEPDPERRLACYDAALAVQPAAPKAPSAPTTAVVAPPAAPKAASAATTALVAPPAAPQAAPAPTTAAATPSTSEFGVRNGPLDVHKFATEAHEMNATVTAVGRRASGLLVITLDNGQSWIENQPSAYFPLKVGEVVQIRSGAIGSYMLYAPSKRFTHVTRIR